MTMEPVNKTQPLSVRTRWRDDFPIDDAWYRYLSRREFTKFLLLISGAFATGQVWIGFLKERRKADRSVEPEIRIARVSEIPVGAAREFFYPTAHERCLLIRLSEERFVAYSDKCTHLMCPVVPQVEEGRLFCPCHKGVFEIEHGRPVQGPPNRPLARINLEIRGDMIFATGMEYPQA